VAAFAEENGVSQFGPAALSQNRAGHAHPAMAIHPPAGFARPGFPQSNIHHGGHSLMAEQSAENVGPEETLSTGAAGAPSNCLISSRHQARQPLAGNSAGASDERRQRHARQRTSGLDEPGMQ